MGAATNYFEAVKWLIESEWLCDDGYYDCHWDKEAGKWVGVLPSEKYGENWKEVLPTRPESEIDTFLDGGFYFHTTTLYGAE